MKFTMIHLSKVFFYSVILSVVLSASVFSADQAKQSIKVSVSLDPALQDKLNPDDTLFVYARAAKGSRMPLAIVSHKAGELPLETQLDASMAMMPQMSLTKFQYVIFMARISASGNAMSQPGDLMGETLPLEWQTLNKPVTIIINKQH
jgi:cytochrome c-type biogenesis protein CcmH